MANEITRHYVRCTIDITVESKAEEENLDHICRDIADIYEGYNFAVRPVKMASRERLKPVHGVVDSIECEVVDEELVDEYDGDEPKTHIAGVRGYKGFVKEVLLYGNDKLKVLRSLLYRE